MVAHVLCPKRHTITSLLTTAGRQQNDWTAEYRLYSSSMDPDAMFRPILKGILELLAPDAPLVVAVDDSLFKKTGRRIPGAGWYRDPLGPPFHTNLIQGFKFIQFSAAVVDPNNPSQARLIPIAFSPIPKLPKPSKDASAKTLAEFEKRKAANAPGAHAARLLKQLRLQVNNLDGHNHRKIWICGDGDYTNATLLRALPARTVYLGRTRGDLNLHAIPASSGKSNRGRPRSYGEALPTPEQLRKNNQIPWQNMTVNKRGVDFNLRFKSIAKAKWHKAGEKTIVRLLVIAPFRYKRKKEGSWSKTRPTYLVATSPHIPVKQLIETYLWRWDIEVNFKDEKQLFGVGQAQVRNPIAVSAAPARAVATYAGLLLAAVRTYGFSERPPHLNAPKWYPQKRKRRVTTSDLIYQFRHECVAGFLNSTNFSDFAPQPPENPNPEKYISPRNSRSKDGAA